MGRCCLDGYGAQGVVCSNLDTGKANARYLCIRPITQQLYRHWKAGKMRPEESFAKWSCKTKRTVFAFSVFKLTILIVQCNVPIMMPVVYKIVQDVADFAGSCHENCGNFFIGV